jgi:hypothetical protein
MIGTCCWFLSRLDGIIAELRVCKAASVRVVCGRFGTGL